MNTPLAVWIGWDSREAIAADVCLFSLLKHSSIPLHVRMLKQQEMRDRGLYTRTSHTENGQQIDDVDGRPFSTEFSFTRFLVPELMNRAGWALFCDCDFLFRADVAELLPLMDDTKAVMVCQQEHRPEEKIKMDGQAQERYFRKNWSSFVLWNCNHPAHKNLYANDVNTEPGSALHAFAWLHRDEIGEIPAQWNWIAGTTRGEPKAVHYTQGGPWFPQCTEVAYAKEWREAYAAACKEARKEAA